MRYLTLNKSKEAAFEIVHKVAKLLKLEISNISKKENFIELSYEGDLTSFGNKIDVHFKVNGAKCRVVIKSRSTALLQIVDWGKNDQLEDKLIDALRKYQS